MNYYEHHLGDYAAATAHLSWDEDMAYTRLLRAYYHHEKPLPPDAKDCYRIARATSSSQKKAVDVVLREFFDLQPDGWHQKRCDEEISRFQDKRSKAKDSAKARWKVERTHSDGNANGMRTHSDGNALNGKSACEGNAPSLQSPDTSKKDRLATARSVTGLNTEAFDLWIGYRAERKPAIKPASLIAAAEELAGFGDAERQAAVVKHSIANGYQGLFEPKDKPKESKWF